MSETITIPLEEPEELEDYAEKLRNIIDVQVSVRSNGGHLPSSDCMVHLCLSREGMIGLATALLRAAHQSPKNHPLVEMLPSTPGHAVERFGVFMDPKSCRLNIGMHDFGDILTLLNAQNDSAGVAG
jgi:hypothetical protein